MLAMFVGIYYGLSPGKTSASVKGLQRSNTAVYLEFYRFDINMIIPRFKYQQNATGLVSLTHSIQNLGNVCFSHKYCFHTNQVKM